MAMNGVEKRLPAFWFNTAVVSRSCSQGQNYLNSTGYRKVVSNNCIKGVKDMYTPRKQMFPNRAPKDLSLSTREGKLTADLHTNVTFLVHLDEGTGRISGRIWSQWQLEPLTTAADSVEAEQGNSMRTKIQLDFGDGTAVSYSILRWIEEGIRHIYKAAGYSVSRPWQKTQWDLRLPPCNSMLRVRHRYTFIYLSGIFNFRHRGMKYFWFLFLLYLVDNWSVTVMSAIDWPEWSLTW